MSLTHERGISEGSRVLTSVLRRGDERLRNGVARDTRSLGAKNKKIFIFVWISSVVNQGSKFRSILLVQRVRVVKKLVAG